MVLPLTNAMLLWLSYFSRTIVEQMSLGAYMGSIDNITGLLDRFSKAFSEIRYSVRKNVRKEEGKRLETYELLIDVEISDTLSFDNNKKRFAPTLFSLVFAYLEYDILERAHT